MINANNNTCFETPIYYSKITDSLLNREAVIYKYCELTNLTKTPWKKKLCKRPPTPSEIASFWTLFPSKFRCPPWGRRGGGGGGDMDIFWNYTVVENKSCLMLSLVCTWHHGDNIGCQEENHLSHFRVNSSRKLPVVLTTNMTALSRGCKLWIQNRPILWILLRLNNNLGLVHRECFFLRRRETSPRAELATLLK